MVDTGFQTIRLSFETLSQDRLRDMSYKVTAGDLEKAVANLEKAGFPRRKIEVYLMVGLPDQDLDEVIRSMLFVHGLGVKIRLAEFSPIPGTVDWKRALEKGHLPRHVDLLLTNNSVYPILRGMETYKLVEQLRYLARVLNQAVDLGINLAGDSQLAESFRKNLTGDGLSNPSVSR